jgi:sugar lactone lactonase YvrE
MAGKLSIMRPPVTGINIWGEYEMKDRVSGVRMRAAGGLIGLAMLGACTAQSGLLAPADIPINGTRVFPESITADAAGNLYVGSTAGIIYRAAQGRTGTEPTSAEPWVRPDAQNGLMSLFGVLADDRRGLLWTCNNPAFGGPPQPGALSSLKGFDLASGALRASHDLPGGKPAACNDIAVAADGAVWLTETAGGRIFVLRPGAAQLSLYAEGADLVGVDGLAFAGDGALYINNVRQHLVQRVERKADGSYAGLTTLELSEPINGPDGLRPLGGNRFLQAEGPGGRVTLVDISGNRAIITPIRTGLDSSPGVTPAGKVGYATEGKIGYLFDPALQGKDPGTFVIRAFPLPEGL